MQPRRQNYKYSSKVVGIPDIAFITALTSRGDQIGLEILNPLDLLSIEGLTTHFFSSITTATKIIRISVQDDFSNPTTIKSLDVNIAVDSLGNINFTKSLTTLLNKTGRNVVVLTFDQAGSGTLKMWKLDMLYTIYGIR